MTDDSRTVMYVDLRLGETLVIGDTRLKLEKKSGQMARLNIEACKSTPVKTITRKSAFDTERTYGQHTIRQGTPAVS